MVVHVSVWPMKFALRLLRRGAGGRPRISVLDDFFPDVLTGFRVAEYNWYLARFPTLNVLSTNPGFGVAHANYAALYPEHADRVMPYDESILDGCGFAYMNFLNNVHGFLPDLERRGIPFLFTLYPGGGFGLNDPESDAKLERVLASRQFRGVTATQPVTVDYLAARVDNAMIHDLNGGCINPTYFTNEDTATRTVPEPGAARICFVAERYMPRGANKGYPEFMEAATRLAAEIPGLRFSVVGSFTEDDVPISPDLAGRIRFLGRLATADLQAFFHDQDIIVSPNKPFVLHGGNFDGFPTGCCVEASLCGVTIVCSDVLDLNRAYVNEQDIVICEPDPAVIADRVGELVADPGRMAAIGMHGRATSRVAFDPQRQLSRRAELLEQHTV